MPTLEDRFVGSLLASALADALGAKHEGGVLIARAVALALAAPGPFDRAAFLAALRDGARSEEYRRRLAFAAAWLAEPPDLRTVARTLGTGIQAHQSAVTALHAFCRYADDFTEMMKYIVALGGDTDTIGAMAGGIFGARNGPRALPLELLVRLQARDRIETAARRLFALPRADR